MAIFRRKFSDRDKKSFFTQLHTLICSGLDFSRAFGLLIECAEGAEKELYSRVFGRVVAGEELWRALGTEPVFTTMDCCVARIGEETGRLPEALDFLTTYYEKRDSRRRMIVSALSYPLITLSVAALVLVFMLLVVVPMFEQVYSRMGGELPGITMRIVEFSDRAPAVLLAISVAAVVFYVLKRLYGKSDSWQRVSSSLWLRTPLCARFVRKWQSARFCRIFHLLVSADVPMLEALSLMRGIVTFYPFRKSLEEAATEVERGGFLSDGLAHHESLYGKRLLVLLRVGEETNTLDSTLLSQADALDSELEHEVRQLNSIVEPLLILLVGAIVAFVLIAMYMPMFRLGMTIG